jgi:uncharacterized protein (TIGR03435 family)
MDMSVPSSRKSIVTLYLCLIFRSSMGLAQTVSQPACTPSQSTPAYVPSLTFEVASVRRSAVDPNGFTVSGDFKPLDSGNLYLQNFDLNNLLALAYEVDWNQIEGLDKKMDRVFYNIIAKSDDATNKKLAAMPKDHLDLEHQHMIQVLLADRFHLKTHWETRSGETYNLVVAKPGKLVSTGAPPTAEEVKSFGDTPIPSLYQRGDSARGFEFIGHGASVSELTSMLASQFGKPVNDKTGLIGKYDFDLMYYQTRSDDRADDETNPRPPLETAIREQLGLKLVPSHGAKRFLVIDHVEALSDN